MGAVEYQSRFGEERTALWGKIVNGGMGVDMATLEAAGAMRNFFLALAFDTARCACFQ